MISKIIEKILIFYLFAYTFLRLILLTRYSDYYDILSYIDYDKLNISFLLILIWLIIFNDYDKYDINKSAKNKASTIFLTYRYILDENGLIKNVYFHDALSEREYEIDYELCIPKGSSLGQYYQFVQESNNYYKLYNYMHNKYMNKHIQAEYDYNKLNRQILKIISILIILGTILIIYKTI